MRVLLGDGFGVTSRQMAMALGRAGHDVAVLAPPGRPWSGYPRCVVRAHPVPAFGVDPWAWTAAVEAALVGGDYDVLLPTGDQVAVLARGPARVTGHGTRLALPSFDALRRVAEPGTAAGTLTELALPQPAGTVVVRDPEDLRQVADPPLYVKTVLGARRVDRREQLLRLAEESARDGVFVDGGGVLVQEPAPGRIVCAQAVFDHGRLVAVHAYEELRASAVKRSVVVPEIREHVAMFGGHLGWHGGLSMVAATAEGGGPVWIDVRPFLGEPANAAASGTDLVGALLAVSSGVGPASMPWGREGVRTRQAGRALRDAARGGRRRALRELARLAVRAEPYRDAAEETLSLRAEPRRIAGRVPRVAALLTVPARGLARLDRIEAANALSPAAWRRIQAGPPPTG